ncbi:MAG TPA: Wadjet anti-phage system protein JetD domain-containing protein [Saprospiraceae bacterium]|nr:Wadjet anti-phage system protein JetD domain-containing protein [Saprospiraceae bacterium]
MISPAEIRKKAARWWPDVLRSFQAGATLFPRELSRIGKVKPTEHLRAFERIRRAQDVLLAQSKSRLGYGYTLRWVERQSRTVGRNRFIDGIGFDTLEDYLAFLGRKKVWRHYCEDWQRIMRTLPELSDWCQDKPQEIVRYQGQWPDLLKVLKYFKQDYQPNRYYIRELPIAVPTKFIESHKAILLPLLDQVLPPGAIRESFQGVRQFEQRYGLRYEEPLVRLRLLDQTLAKQYFSGLQDWSIPLRDFEGLSLPLKRAIILENKTSYNNLLAFLTLPQLRATVGIWGSGFRVGLLQQAQWLQEIDLYYWGDIDAHGLQILAQLRSYFPGVRPLLMDRATLDAFPEYQVEAPESTVTHLVQLTPAEQDLYHYLNTHRLRLEQERIPLAYVRTAMERIEA